MSLAQLFNHLTQVLDGAPLEVQGAVSASDLAEMLAAADATLCACTLPWRGVGFRPHGATFPPEAPAVCLAPFIEGLALYAWLEYGDDAPPAGEAALHVPPVFELKCAPEEVLSVLERAA